MGSPCPSHHSSTYLCGPFIKQTLCLICTGYGKWKHLVCVWFCILQVPNVFSLCNLTQYPHLYIWSLHAKLSWSCRVPIERLSFLFFFKWTCVMIILIFLLLMLWDFSFMPYALMTHYNFQSISTFLLSSRNIPDT